MDATTATTTPATPKKLRDGSWGALAQSESVAAGDTVKITTKAGKSWTATVSKVLWSGDGKAICRTRSSRGAIDNDTSRCGICGGLLSDFDLDASAVPGYHFDCA
jgi:hypothetical protein